LKESEEFDWVPELHKVIVVVKGAYYPTNLEAMVELNVTGAEKFADKYGYRYWNTPEYQNWSDITDYWRHDSEDFLHLKIPSLGKPKEDDICYLIEKYVVQGSTKIYKLVRIGDNREFIMADYGFKPIN
jgi:hypothetical protein